MSNTSPTETSNQHDSEVAIQAAVFRRLLKHLNEHKEVQNIELMNIAGFCRNCFAKWTVDEAEKLGVNIDIESAKERIYGMPYHEWKAKYQTPATPEQLAVFNVKHK